MRSSGCWVRHTLADIHTAKRRSERFAKSVIVEVELHDDVVPVARRPEPNEGTVVAVEPIAHGTESVSKPCASNEYQDDPHSELPIKVLYPVNPRLRLWAWKRFC
jgi:hypothetical protein